MWRRWFSAAVLTGGMLLAACGKGAKTPTRTPTAAPTATPTAVATPTTTPTPAPTPTWTPTSTPVSVLTPAPAQSRGEEEVRAYIAQVFPPGPGRDDVFLVCTSCHGISVIILGGQSKDRDAWQATRYSHDYGIRGWAVEPTWHGSRQESHDLIWEYLMDHFGPDKPPPPPMPERLRIGWQTY